MRHFSNNESFSYRKIISKNVVNALFSNRVIFPNEDIPLRPRSPDLTKCNIFFWGYMKRKLHQDKAQRVVASLKERVRQEALQIPLVMLRNVMIFFKVLHLHRGVSKVNYIDLIFLNTFTFNFRKI